MRELLLKDLAALRWYLPVLYPFYALYLAGVTTSPPIFVLMTLLGSFGLASAPLFLEEIQGTELLWRSLPVSGAEIVLARYVATFGGICCGAGTSALASRLVTGDAWILTSALTVFSLSAAAAIFLPFYFRFGAGRALHLSALVALGLAIAAAIPGAALRALSPETLELAPVLLNRWRGPVVVLLAAAALVLLSVSAGLAIRASRSRPD